MILRSRLDRLSILNFGPNILLSDFRKGIAQETEWEHDIYEEWPRFSIPEPWKNLSTRQSWDCTGERATIHGWHLYKKGAVHDFPRSAGPFNLPRNCA